MNYKKLLLWYIIYIFIIIYIYSLLQNISVDDLDSLEKVSHEISISVQLYDNFDHWENQTKHVSYLLKQISIGGQSVISAGFTGICLIFLYNK